VIIDARRVRPVTADFSLRFVAWISDWSIRLRGTRWAVLVSSGVSYGAARELALHADAKQIRAEAFTDLRESVRWLQGKVIFDGVAA
jgi:hypothetical protein